MNHRGRGSGVWASLTVVLAGCSSLPSDATTFEDQLVDATCAWQIHCGQLAQVESYTCGIDGRRYFRKVAPAVVAEFPTEAINAGRARFDAEAAAECVDQISRASCSTGTPFLAAEACARVYVGKVSIDGGCTGDVDCATGFCTATSSACAGVCAAWAAEGESCVNARCNPAVDVCGVNSTCELLVVDRSKAALSQACDAGDCADGLWCDTSQHCASRVDGGESCLGEGACPDGQRCAGVGAADGGTCTAFLDLDAPCDPNASACAFDEVCDSSSKTCVHAPASHEGTACDGGCVDPAFYSPGLFCNAAGVCAASRLPGESCADDSNACVTSCEVSQVCASSSGCP